MWYEGSSAVERRYYDWSLARTRQHACADVRDALDICDAQVSTQTDDSAVVTVVMRR